MLLPDRKSWRAAPIESSPSSPGIESLDKRPIFLSRVCLIRLCFGSPVPNEDSNSPSGLFGGNLPERCVVEAVNQVDDLVELSALRAKGLR
jgi:hypothetical protein